MCTALLTDLYQLTMGQGYWKHGSADREAVFHLSYRRAPFGGEGTITAGIGPAADHLDGLGFTGDELGYLAGLPGADGRPLFDAGYLGHLRDLQWALEVDAIPEGAVSFPHQPLVRVRGPLLQCQLVETALLNIVNFQTLVATQAARLCEAAGGDPVLEFGLRRAQGPDGGLSASRAAYIGGCAGTSNVLAGMRHGIPVRGTHAHSWVMSFDREQDAFDAYAEAMPNNVVLLVDTYDTREGVRNAIRTGRKLRARGHDLLGIRLDSGDLATLSIAARALLDAAGFHGTRIVASNDLDEEVVRDVLYNEVDPNRRVPAGSAPLLTPVVRRGRRVRPDEPLAAVRDRAIAGWRGLTAAAPVRTLDPSLGATRRALLLSNGFQP